MIPLHASPALALKRINCDCAALMLIPRSSCIPLLPVCCVLLFWLAIEPSTNHQNKCIISDFFYFQISYIKELGSNMLVNSYAVISLCGRGHLSCTHTHHAVNNLVPTFFGPYRLAPLMGGFLSIMAPHTIILASVLKSKQLSICFSLPIMS